MISVCKPSNYKSFMALLLSEKSREITKKFDEGRSVLDSLMIDLHAFGDEERLVLVLFQLSVLFQFSVS